MMRDWPTCAIIVLVTGGVASAEIAVPELNAPDLSSVSLAAGARATKLVGSEIYARDADIGTIDDVIVDLQSGRVRAVIVSIDGLLRDRLVAVPPSAIKVGTNDRLTIDATPDELKATPVFQYDNKSARE